MKKPLALFFPLYTTTLLMLLGSGLLTTYISLRLSAIHVSGAMIGAIIAANYIGLVIGGKIGHILIARVGHIRAYVSCSGIITAAVLGHGLTEMIPIWVVLRLIIGLCMMCQYMVLESWLNDQAEAAQRGVVFGFYMVASYLGMALGQVVLMINDGLGVSTLIIIALCFSLCLVPIALTTRTNVSHMSPAPMELKFFIGAIPKVLATTLLIGMVVGSFYGLAPIYTSQQELTTQQTGLFMALAIFAGLLAQFPLSWLSDHYNRNMLMRINAVLLAVTALPLAIFTHISFPVLLGVGFVVSLMQFTLYPLVVALANDMIEPERRVSLSACLLMAFGVGACIGPLAVGALIEPLGGNILYAFFALCGGGIVALSRTSAKEEETVMAVDAPLPHIAMPDSLSSSPLSPALNPAFDEQLIQETMPAPEMANEDAAANDDIEKEEEEEPSAFAPQGADPDADTGLQRAFTLLEESAPEEPPEEKERRVL
ncbi:MFS family permease [Ewingella americana]|uniref:Putative membrane protein n=1 Tax=Ewingella americana (strain ATCC 33852 / DSM 4580 / CCUG 14506 / JCM 5911 / LMG 7869 / NCTC 12157 / CDC 1468-78) TaxID=910964 RepID=A0A085GLC7_EWIA3|nr:MFS transporter [Ewingella americana]KAA8728946.1 MFS transporter [Ewingella americana]KFC84522.1 putative membrane protein [Ewingella americana ATCC 33852]MRT04261.1 MFS transporter [Ewingella americana]PKB87040.1 MFS transporter [Ewingella americana]QMV52499.1 MFS transporter [Ewingella americana]